MRSTAAKKHLFILASFAQSLINFRGPLIRDVLAAGHRVSVGAPGITAELRAKLEAMGVEAYETPLQRTGTDILVDLRYSRDLARLMRRIEPDVILTYTIKPNIWGAFAASREGLPVVAMVTGLGYAFTQGTASSLRQRMVRSVARRLYRAATNRNRNVIFQNPDDREDFVALGCLADASKAAMVDGSGVDTAHYARAPLPDAPIFLMVARLLRNKGVREYGEAALRVIAAHPEARCLLVGPFDEGPDSITQDQIDRWIAGGLEYLGPLEDVRPAIAQASIYVLPSYREGTPRSVLEAMAMGRAIVTTDAPGCRETVANGENGFLIPVRDPTALMEAMEKFICDPFLIISMGDKSYEVAQDKYDVRKVNAEMLKILRLH